jgi:tRNA (guanine-N7-)-methyltransferase
MPPTRVWAGGVECDLRELPAPLRLDELLAGTGRWEVEIGFGKGRYLVGRAGEHRQHRFLGVEVASQYYRLARDRASRRNLSNLALIRGEAIYLMATALGAGWAEAVHVYFPDPWPKDRHHKRRLFDPLTVDLVLGLLQPGGRLYFASDFLEYGNAVRQLLAAHPGVELEVIDEPWPDGARTNYEAKFVAEGRPIIRLVAKRRSAHEVALLHPEGRTGILAATGGMDPGPAPGAG